MLLRLITGLICKIKAFHPARASAEQIYKAGRGKAFTQNAIPPSMPKEQKVIKVLNDRGGRASVFLLLTALCVDLDYRQRRWCRGCTLLYSLVASLCIRLTRCSVIHMVPYLGNSNGSWEACTVLSVILGNTGYSLLLAGGNI